MIESEMVSTPSGTLHVRVIGAGPSVILLHGFPDSSLGFRELCQELAARGFRAIAPDLRGYGLSSKPEGLEAYRSSALLEDLAALVRWTGEERVTLLGHDWGGMLAFCFASQRPELVERLVVLNAPHPESYARALTRSRQLLRSWYLLLFQLRGLAEWLVTRRWVFHWLLHKLVAKRELLSDAAVEGARRELLRPGAARAALSYYRAAFRWPLVCPATITVPTLILWGQRDPALDSSLLDDLPTRVEHLTICRLEEAGHFVHWDEPERVVSELSAFLRV
ncbi:MAG TPA: alpha/beta hydrolase [Polyangiaceae bacterium]